MKKVKITVAIILAAITIFFVGCTAKKDKVPVIGISQYGEHASLDNCREGFLLGLKEAGLTEGEDYTIDYQNASFDNATATQIANNFSSKNVALMCAIATPSATACYAAAEDKNIPVVFNAITDPGEAGLTTGNITGVSDKLPVDPQLELIRNSSLMQKQSVSSTQQANRIRYQQSPSIKKKQVTTDLLSKP